MAAVIACVLAAANPLPTRTPDAPPLVATPELRSVGVASSPPEPPSRRPAASRPARGHARAAATRPAPPPAPRRDRPGRAAAPLPRLSGRLAAVVAFALDQVGEPYRWGASGPHAWDCSGLVAGAYARIGVRLPHQSERMRHHRRVRLIPRSAMRPGDLVWPHRGHVGIYIGGGRIVHAATPSQGVRLDPLYAFMAAGRVV